MCRACAHSPFPSLAGVAEAATAAVAPVLAGQGEVLYLLRSLAASAARQPKSVIFSKVSTTLAAEAVGAVGVEIGGRLALPADLDRYMPAGELAPFEWSAGGGRERAEVDASAALLELLEGWVKRGAEPPVDNLFLDVQAGPPMSLLVEGVAHFSGVPDAIVTKRSIEHREEAVPFSAAAVFTVDWKRRSVMESSPGRIAATGHVHALAVASAKDFVRGQPVFFTDLATGVRAWIVLNSTLYYLHGAHGLSLVQGVALMRYFIARSAEGDALVVVDATLTSDRATREAIPRAAQPSGGAGSAAPEEGPPAGGAFESSAAGAGSAPTKLHGRCTAAMEKSPESAATESDDDGVDADFRTLAVSIAHDLARGGGVSLEGW